MRMRAKNVGLFLCVIVMTAFAVPVAAEDDWNPWFYHDDPNFLWYINQAPGFRITVPANPYRLYTRDLFGEKAVTFYFGPNGPIFTMGIVPKAQTDIPKLRDALVNRWTYNLANLRIDADQQMISNKNVPFHFHVRTGDAPNGERAMVRAVFFENDSHIVYLTLVIPQAEYVPGNFARTAWLEAVNSFVWDS